jgi:hypothetical protein
MGDDLSEEKLVSVARSDVEHLSDEELWEMLEELLYDFGFDLDRAGLEKLCDNSFSAGEVVDKLLGPPMRNEGPESDWVWVCVATLWERWWPDKVCEELLEDRVRAGYAERELGNWSACAEKWLHAWVDVLCLCDATGTRSIKEFGFTIPDEGLYNWIQDLEEALWDAGLSDPEFLRARIEFCEEALRRFPHEDQLMMENRRCALAESYFETGLIKKADELFEAWLTAEPSWVRGWIAWADCYVSGIHQPKDHARAEELLRRGYSIPGLRHRDCLADRLRLMCEETGRLDEAREFERQVRQL